MSSNDSHGYGMPVHPVCDMFPLMTRIELDALVDDITAHGLMNPVVVHHGELVDGRNRLVACKEAGVTPRIVEWRSIYDGSQSLAEWIWSMNAERRHLTEDQYVAIRVDVTGYIERDAARIKQVAAGKEHGRGRGKVMTERSEAIPKQKPAPTTRKKIAKQLGVSERRVQHAMNVQKHQPELLKEVQHGKIPLHEAAKRVATPSTKPMKPKHVLRVDHCLQCSMVAATLKELRSEITRRRNEMQAQRERRRWNIDNVDKVELIHLLNHIEQQLDLIAADPAKAAPHSNPSREG